MKTHLPLIASALLLIGLTQAGSARAVQGTLSNTTVARTTVTVPEQSGGCTATLGAALNTAVPPVNCSSNIVSFGCDGKYITKDLAFYMLDQAQLALSLNKKVTVMVDDTKKYGNYCFARRIDVIK